MPTTALSPSHPLLPGTLVPVFHFDVPHRPYLEGRAIIRSAITEFPGLYRVRFESERDKERYRLVHTGDWQTSPEEMLESLIAQWRLTLMPELAADFWSDLRLHRGDRR